MSQNRSSHQHRSDAPVIPEGMEAWRSPSNIALVKYWGKKAGQLPGNPSVSMTLSKSFTETRLWYSRTARGEGQLRSFSFHGRPEPSFCNRIRRWLNDVRPLYPFLRDFDLVFESFNNFPHSAGLASSASAISSMALCLSSMEESLFNIPGDHKFYRKASHAARLGSGSASRSVFPGFVIWGQSHAFAGSADEYAVQLTGVHPLFADMRDSILIVDGSPKAVPSSQGHSMMAGNPWAGVRYRLARDNAAYMVRILSAGDLDEFVRIVEYEALVLHSLMMSSDPGFILLKPGTLGIIERVREFRKFTGVPVAFTMDAGPNVHLIYPGIYEDKINSFISGELLRYCCKSLFIKDCIGKGPVRIERDGEDGY